MKIEFNYNDPISNQINVEKGSKNEKSRCSTGIERESWYHFLGDKKRDRFRVSLPPLFQPPSLKSL